MKNKDFLDNIRIRIVECGEQGLDIDIHLAEIAGWTNLRYLPGGSIIGIPPSESHRVREIPRYTTTLDGAVSFIPDKWVESYRHRFDGTYRVECHPRGDLGCDTVHDESESLIRGMLSVGLMARMKQMD